MGKVIDAAEQRLEEELERKIADAKAEYKERLEEELERAEDDTDKMIKDDKAELQEKAEKRMKELRKDAQDDEEIQELKDKVAVCEKKTKQKSQQLSAARKRLAKLHAGDDDDSGRD